MSRTTASGLASLVPIDRDSASLPRGVVLGGASLFCTESLFGAESLLGPVDLLGADFSFSGCPSNSNNPSVSFVCSSCSFVGAPDGADDDCGGEVGEVTCAKAL